MRCSIASNGSRFERPGAGVVGSSCVLLGALDARLDPDEVRAVGRAYGADDATDLALRCEACVAELVAHLTLDEEAERAASRAARALRVLLVRVRVRVKGER